MTSTVLRRIQLLRGGQRHSHTPIGLERQLAVWASVVIFAYFLFVYVGTRPFSGGEFNLVEVSRGGNVLKQGILVSLVAAVSPLFLWYRRRTIDLCRGAAPLLLLFAWFAASALWSAYPEITIRRIVAEAMVLTIVFAAAMSITSIRGLVYPILGVMALIALVDAASVVLVPDIAIGPIGALGLHSSKNVAGSLMLLAVLFIGGFMLTVRDRVIKLAAGFVLLAAAGFLVMTQSKTSLGIVVLLGLTFPLFYVVYRGWRPAPFMLLPTSMTLVGLIALVMAVLNLSFSDLAAMLFGDPTLTRRTELWSFLTHNISEKPLLGAGWGAFWDVGQEANPINAMRWTWVLYASEINSAHNGYLDVWIQAGVVGFALSLVVHMRVVWVYGVLVRDARVDPHERSLMAILLCVLIAISLNNFLESLMFRPGDGTSHLFFLIYLAGERWRQMTQHTFAPVY